MSRAAVDIEGLAENAVGLNFPLRIHIGELRRRTPGGRMPACSASVANLGRVHLDPAAATRSGFFAARYTLPAASAQIRRNAGFTDRLSCERSPTKSRAMTDPDEYRKLAEECRQQAEKCQSASNKEQWLEMAEEWIRLADHLTFDRPPP